jgi:hypothetical protein
MSEKFDTLGEEIHILKQKINILNKKNLALSEE